MSLEHVANNKELHITPNITKKEHTIVFKERIGTYIRNMLLFWSVPVALFVLSCNTGGFLSINLFMFFIMLVTISFCVMDKTGVCLTPIEVEQKLTRISFPTDYFKTTSEPTAYGVKYYVMFSEKGDKEIPQDLKKRFDIGSIPWKIAKFVDNGAGEMIFDFSDSGKISTKYHYLNKNGYIKNTNTFLPSTSKRWLATIDNELLPVDGHGFYILPDNILTPYERVLRQNSLEAKGLEGD